MRIEAPGPSGGTIVIDDALLTPHREALAARGPAAPVRTAFAAVHVVMRAEYALRQHAPDRPGDPDEIAECIDLPATMALRRRLDRLGLGVAEAMDTAQRFALGWPGASRLIRECGALGLENGFVAGAGTDQRARIRDRNDLVDAVVEQIAFIRKHGGIPIVLPMVWLAENARGPDDYVEVYGAIIRQCEGPLLVHWLGAAFMPVLEGYFPGDSFDRIMAADPETVRGCKLSLLDADLERRVRSELRARGQVVFTGDDLHFAELIAGEPGAEVEDTVDLAGRPLALGAFSHALLGVLDGVAVPAALALQALAHGDRRRYCALMAPCEAFGQHVFGAPTHAYKAGLAFVSWLNGHQENFMLVNREDTLRDAEHLLRTAELAAAAGALTDARVAAERLRLFAGEAAP